ncbi:hypothetical protein Q1695_006448 [Nippostrongylus brasiliensis]|nr:hypothetical protein Q1695_006448 [Nippostrongylus brasiliensis]
MLILLLTLWPFGLAKYCQLTTNEEIEKAAREGNCDYIYLDLLRDDMSRHKKLYDAIKNVKQIKVLKLRKSNLKKITEQKKVLLDSNGELTLENNLELSVLPKFEITDPSTTYVTIYGNPKLDTEDIIQTCKARKCAVAAIQRPFSCGFPLPKKVKCRVVEGTVRMEKSTAKQMEDVEEIRGHLIFRGSELTSFPKFKNLRILTQRGKEKVLTVSNNPDLEDIVALYGVTIHNETANAVEIEKNPKLCVEDRERNVEFVWKFMQQIPRCNPAQPRGSSKGQKGKKPSGKKLSQQTLSLINLTLLAMWFTILHM